MVLIKTKTKSKSLYINLVVKDMSMELKKEKRTSTYESIDPLS